ncbi:hypothetical protein, variant [Aphanomyces astaci]|uniref:Methyltransferase domain-containing protein n=1 Tax=Aphanomyces astaci TaxID=112090 RepID=W4H551_APHAT|nr:hypothetical protein, variant [Aphanomyces astaci]ETV86268.1 hypothetical protein, variant [Aphanomyces astaci]|eukprot:XP_009824740.1 hypothetical protein, variant [Aphanomyces astaci]
MMMLAGRRSFWSSAKSALTKGKETISRISKINDTADIVDGLSSIGLNQLHVFPEPLRQRVSMLLKERTQVQLEKLKETITLGTSKSRFPWDSHNEQIGWEMDKKAKIPEFLYGPQETMAYMAFEMDGVYSSVHHVLRQMTDADGEATPFQPKSMLDFGSGPGTASWVAKEFFDESLQEYRLVEPSQSMADAANVIMEGFRGLSFRKSLGEMKREIAKGKQYDLIMASFVLSDITNDIERIAIVSTLWSLLAENGRLVLVDRGNSWGSLQVRSARQFILDSLTTNADEVVVSDDATPRIQGGKVLGPCPHQKECPMKEGEWCHFVQRTPRVTQPRLPTTQRWAGYTSMKFSYVTIEKKASHNSETDVATRTELPPARMTRGPLLSSRHVTLDLCHPEV